MKAIVGILALLGVVQSAVAGGTYTGVFKLDYYGSLYIDASATQRADRPACATRTYVRLQEAKIRSCLQEQVRDDSRGVARG